MRSPPVGAEPTMRPPVYPPMRPPMRRARLVVALGLGAAWGGYAWWFNVARHYRGGDFRQLWLGARALLAGLDPYVAVQAWETAAGYGAGKPGLYYPLPAVLVFGLPVAWLPVELAAGVIVGVGVALAAYGATRDRWATLAAFAGPSMLVVAQNGQTVPFLLAAMLGPPALAWVLTLKPTTGAAAWTARPSLHTTLVASGVGGLLLLVTFALVPAWPAEWLARALSGHYSRVIVASAWWTPVLLLAALRWREPAARLLLALAVVPHTPFLQDEMLLGAIPRTWREAFYATVWAHVVVGLWGLTHPGPRSLWTGVPWFVAAVYLPALGLVLRPAIAARVPRPSRRRVPSPVAPSPAGAPTRPAAAPR